MTNDDSRHNAGWSEIGMQGDLEYKIAHWEYPEGHSQ